MPFLAAPWFLLGLAALPMLAGIYWLRNRFRPRTVSTLMLWTDQREPREGGRRVKRMQMPLLFFLELGTLLLLGAAAAGPMILSRQETRPLVVVLDDSFSMLARSEGTRTSSRERAQEAVLGEIGGDRSYRVSLILAGTKAQILARDLVGTGEVREALNAWKCLSAAGEVEGALGLACEIGEPTARVLVVTDHAAPEDHQGDSRVVWRAFGRECQNVGFVNAVRLRSETGNTGETKDRCLLEVTNFGTSPARRTETIRTLKEGGVLKQEEIVLGPGETHRELLALPAGTGDIEVELSGDELALDDRVFLLEEPEPKVSVRVQVEDAGLAREIRRALQATKRADLEGLPVELLLTDSSDTSAGPNTWVVRFLGDPGGMSYAGPFIVNRTHPLTRGLSLEGVVWSGGGKRKLSGSPLVVVEDVALLTDLERPDGTHEVQISLNRELSTLQESVDWPVLMWNVMDWRVEALSGVREANRRLGDVGTVVLPRGMEKVVMHAPTGETREMTAPAGRVTVPLTEVGVFEIEGVSDRSGKEEKLSWRLSSSALSALESDLRGCASGQWGDWRQSASLLWDYVSIAWVLVLGAMALLTAHQLLLARSSRDGHRRQG
jgi:hypothetical protein